MTPDLPQPDFSHTTGDAPVVAGLLLIGRRLLYVDFDKRDWLRAWHLAQRVWRRPLYVHDWRLSRYQDTFAHHVTKSRAACSGAVCCASFVVTTYKRPKGPTTRDLTKNGCGYRDSSNSQLLVRREL